MVKQLRPASTHHDNDQANEHYRDRANERRGKIGSDNPYVKDDPSGSFLKYFKIFQKFKEVQNEPKLSHTRHEN